MHRLNGLRREAGPGVHDGPVLLPSCCLCGGVDVGIVCHVFSSAGHVFAAAASVFRVSSEILPFHHQVPSL